MAKAKADSGRRQRSEHRRKPRAPRPRSVSPSDEYRPPRAQKARQRRPARRKGEQDAILPYDDRDLGSLSPLTEPPSPVGDGETVDSDATPGPPPVPHSSPVEPEHDCEAVEKDLIKARGQVTELATLNENIQDRAEAREVELTDRVQSLEAKVGPLTNELRSAQATIGILEKQLEEITSELKTATADLVRIRNWTTFKTEDNTALFNLFDDINDKVDDAAYQFADVLNIPSDDSVTMDDIGVNLIDSEDENSEQRDLNAMIRPFLQHCVAASIGTEDALRQVTTAVCHQALAKRVFDQFTPCLSSDLNNVFTNMCSALSHEEMQVTSGMWRAHAYTHVKRHRSRTTQEDAEELASTVVGTMDVISRQLLVRSPDSIEKIPRSLDRLRLDLAEMYDLATGWQDLARGTHISVDYTTFLCQPGYAFSDDQMLREGPASPESTSSSEPATVLLPVKMGLKAWSTERGESRTRICRIVRKAGVV